MNLVKRILFISPLMLILAACSQTEQEQSEPSETKPEKATSQVETNESDSTTFDVDYEMYTLDNGLKVILHVDKSDPIVAMATVVNVGSNREKPGRTGFAHFFEHMAFNDSENVPKGANRKMIPELGGTRNGGTWSDGTIYYEVVPKDAFDKLLWIDSDRLGFMINTVDAGTLEREKQVVKNEKRQRVDNRAYGHTSHVIKKALYPKDHPYNWTVIGDLEDLQAATLEDVREFYDAYYGPANATLVIAGDIDIEETKQKVEYWFGEIKSGQEVEPLQPRHVTLEETKKLYHVDNFARLPELRLTFPTVEQFTPEAYALNALASILSSGKNAALYKAVVEESKLAPGVAAWNRSEMLTGTFTIRVRGNAGTKLDDIYAAVMAGLADFEKNGFTDAQLTKIKAEQETSFYYAIESILDKALQLGIYNEQAGSPDFIKQDIANIVAVTREDIMAAYNKFIKDKPAIITSFVPKTQEDLILTGSEMANVVEEEIKQGAEERFFEIDKVKFTKTPTKNDRSEPPLGELTPVKIPAIWHSSLENGMRPIGIKQSELPLVNFNLQIKGGQALDPKDKLGTSFLLAQLMNEGTKNKTALELEEAIGLLGARLQISGSREGIQISGNTLAKNFSATMDLMREMLLEPRFDSSEFERLKSARITSIKQRQSNPNAVAYDAFMKQIYGPDHLAGSLVGGNESTVTNIELEDLKAFYKNNLTPANATFHIVGSVGEKEVNEALAKLSEWKGDVINLPDQPKARQVEKPEVFFIDIPNAKQSVIMMGKAAIPSDDPDYYPIVVANTNLGGGISGRLAQTLRIQKGYTYGAYSSLSTASSYAAPFLASSQVRSNVTLESLELFKELVGDYKETFGEDDLEVTRNMIIKGNSRRFETLDQLLGMLVNISRYNRPYNYVEQQQDYVQALTLEQVHNTVTKHMDEQQMIYVVAGDAKTQLPRIKDLGYGEPVILDISGKPVADE